MSQGEAALITHKDVSLSTNNRNPFPVWVTMFFANCVRRSSVVVVEGGTNFLLKGSFGGNSFAKHTEGSNLGNVPVSRGTSTLNSIL